MSHKKLTLSQCLKRLNELSELEDGWLEGDGADFTNKDFSIVQRFLTDITYAGLTPPYLYPTEEGGLSVEWNSVFQLFFTIDSSLKSGRLICYDSFRVTILDQKFNLDKDSRIFAKVVSTFLRSGSLENDA